MSGDHLERIPIHDDSAPIACTAGRDGLPLRKAQIGRLRAFDPSVERSGDGLVLHFANRPEIAAEVADFTVAEKGCCAFWGFAVASTPDRLTLRWDGPLAVAHVLDQLAAYFAGDAELDAIDGLL